jgi:hypothetical protein
MSRNCKLLNALYLAFCVLVGYINAEINYMNATGGSFPVSLYQQSTFFYQFQSPSDNLLYDGPDSSAGKCNIMGYWSAKNSRQMLYGQYVSLPSSFTSSTISTPSGTPTSRQSIEDNMCNDACTLTNGCGFDSCLTPKPDAASREPLGKTYDCSHFHI